MRRCADACESALDLKLQQNVLVVVYKYEDGRLQGGARDVPAEGRARTLLNRIRIRPEVRMVKIRAAEYLVDQYREHCQWKFGEWAEILAVVAARKDMGAAATVVGRGLFGSACL